MADYKLYQGDCLHHLPSVPDNSIDLTVTSPPYDNLRKYGKEFDADTFNWRAIIDQLWRVTAKGGCVVWVVGDATIDGSETGTSFTQALYAKEIGFRLETMIYRKKNFLPKNSGRYENAFEYMFMWSKGKPKSVNLLTKLSKDAGRDRSRGSQRGHDDKLRGLDRLGKTAQYSTRSNIFEYVVGQEHFNFKGVSSHPAIFPYQLAYDQVITWSNQGDTILDPMMGSGTTGVVSMKTGRNFIGVELVPDFYDLAEQRIKNASGEFVPTETELRNGQRPLPMFD